MFSSLISRLRDQFEEDLADEKQKMFDENSKQKEKMRNDFQHELEALEAELKEKNGKEIEKVQQKFDRDKEQVIFIIFQSYIYIH